MTETKKGKLLGTVREVDGSSVIVQVSDAWEGATASPGEGEDYHIGQPGSFIVINTSPRTKVIAIVSGMRMVEVQVCDASGGLKCADKKRIEAQLVGEVVTIEEKGKTRAVFKRGIGFYPVVSCGVFIPDAAELSEIFEEYSGFDYSIGQVTTGASQKCYLHFDRLFGKHVAVLGATGSGKSCCVATMVQKATDPKMFPHSHVVILDLHNEYRTAFPDANYIKSSEITLPYWLMTFSELCETFTEKTEHSAHNQLRFFRDNILSLKKKSLEKATANLEKYIGAKNYELLADRLTVDTPVFFDIDELVALAEAEDEPLTKSAKYLGKFILRLQSKTGDRRLKFLMDVGKAKSSEVFPEILKKLIGMSAKENKRVTILDLSGIPSEILSVVVSVIARTLFDFNFWNLKRVQFPICLVCEEAHTYLMRDAGGETWAAGEQLERIAKEGRKYGVGLVVSSQRPSDLSATVLSQCNTFINLRLTNQEDQGYVKRLVPDSLANFLDALPSLQRGEALIVGDSVVMPTRVQIDRPNPEPSSHDVEFHKYWKAGPEGFNLTDVVTHWWLQEKE
jgi:DNA helicase HerA-like ATPase